MHQPFVVPTFLNLSVFSLELIRQRIIIENEHFLNFRKSSDIKFPWAIGPFVIKNKAALPLIESMLREMGFPTEAAINYDPHHIIFIRRQANKNKPFEHHEVASLPETSNWSDDPQEKQGNYGMEEDSTSSIQGKNSPPLGTSSLG